MVSPKTGNCGMAALSITPSTLFRESERKKNVNESKFGVGFSLGYGASDQRSNLISLMYSMRGTPQGIRGLQFWRTKPDVGLMS